MTNATLEPEVVEAQSDIDTTLETEAAPVSKIEREALKLDLLESLKPELAQSMKLAVAKMFASGMEAMSSGVAQVVAGQFDRAADAIDSAIDTRLNAMVDKIGARLVKIEIATGDSVATLPEGLYHAAFQEVIEAASIREEIYLPGPAGCGKSHLCGQVAKALGLRFESINFSAGVTETALVGRCTPNLTTGESVYESVPFVECFENGGVFLLDEIDAADPNVLMTLNGALANGRLPIRRPGNPVAVRHPDFICIAAANTLGNGADMQYCARNQLDESSLDRFRMNVIPMDYCENLEKALCPDAELRGVMLHWRSKIREHGLNRILSTRAMVKAYKCKQRLGWAMKKVADRFFAGWPADEREKVESR